MGLINNLNAWVRARVVGWLEGVWDSTYTDRVNNILLRRNYRLGEQKRSLKPSREGYDDNIVGNFLGLALDRGISLLFGKEVKFDFGKDANKEAVDFINDIWEANNKPILLHDLAQYGGEDGTVFVKLVPDEEKQWRIVPQDPVFKDVITDPDDSEKVISYITQYKYYDFDNNEISRRETITAGNYFKNVTADEGGNAITVIMQGDPNEIAPNWHIENFILSRKTGGKWTLESEEVWPYPVPPIVHWKNLPFPGNVWGMPDIPDDVMGVQDKSNFAISNINRIIRLFAHPPRWSKFFGGAKVGSGGSAELDLSPTAMPNSDNPNAEINQLPPVGDVPGAVSHAQNLRQIIFDVTRNTDITSMKDKVGALTNFGLRILFFDALNKLETKRNLYGWGLREINRRLFIFSGQEPVDCEILWEDPLPIDEKALRENCEADLRMGVVDKQTISERLGYDWETVKERLDAQQEEEMQQQADIGAIALKNFDRFGLGAGGGANNGGFGKQKQPVAR